MAVKKKQTVHWEYRGTEVKSLNDCESDALAFIYRIELLDGTDRYYIGRKTMLKPKFTSGKNKGISKGEYSWKTYCGSSKELTEILKSGVPYRKEILHFTFSKAETSYKETVEILCSGALTDPKAFNFWVKSLIYSKHLKPNS